MLIYNVTINIEESAHDRWLHWMKTEHIPAMLATGKFTKALLSKVLVEEEMGGVTYSVQYSVGSRETLQRYYAENAETLRAQNPFLANCVVFRTELKIIGEARPNPPKGRE